MELLALAPAMSPLIRIERQNGPVDHPCSKHTSSAYSSFRAFTMTSDQCTDRRTAVLYVWCFEIDSNPSVTAIVQQLSAKWLTWMAQPSTFWFKRQRLLTLVMETERKSEFDEMRKHFVWGLHLDFYLFQALKKQTQTQNETEAAIEVLVT